VSIPPYVLSTFVGAVLWSTSIVSKASRARDMAATINEEILLLEAGEAFRRLLVSAFVCYIFAKRINHSSHQSVFQSTRGCPSQS